MNSKCPTDELMAEYLDGILPDADQDKLEAHIADCDICLDTITEGNRLIRGGGVIDTDPVPAHVTRSALDAVTRQAQEGRGIFARRLKQSAKTVLERLSDAVLISPSGALRPAPIRGSLHKLGEDRALLKKTFKEVDTEIEIEKNATGSTHIRVRLAGDARTETGVRVSLQKAAREVSSQLLGMGYVVFEDVPFDQYCLVFTRDGKSIGAYSFEIKETMND